MSLPRYPNYKPSGVEWLGDVPSHWATVRLRQLGRLLKGSGGSKEDVVDEGVPCVRYGDLYTTHRDFITNARTRVSAERAVDYVPLQPGDVLFAGSGETFEEIGKSAVNLIDGEAVCGGDLIILRPEAPVDPRFLGYACDSSTAAAQKAMMGRGTTVKHIYPDELRHLALCVPPQDEQAVIAAFLDRETAKIDALVAQQERLIQLLKEKRQAVISHAVTKGLNPDAPMKPSGIEWLGDVPRHWTVTRIKRLSAVSNGSTPNRERRDYWDEGTFPWLNSAVVNSDPVAPPDQFITPLALAECHLPIARPPAVVVGITGQGKTRGMASRLLYEATISQHLVLLQPAPGVDVSFLRRALEMAYPYLRRDSEEAGSTKGAITCEALGNLAVACPSVEEQCAIADFLATAASHFERLVSESVLAVEVLRERRSALISAAVTGQLDVRGLSIPADA